MPAVLGAGQAKLRELIRSGERHPQDPRALLWRSFMQVVERLRPDAVLVENVPDLPTWDDGAVLSGFLETLGDLGYTVDAQILDCFRYGVPQHRSRLLLTGLRGADDAAGPSGRRAGDRSATRSVTFRRCRADSGRSGLPYRADDPVGHRSSRGGCAATCGTELRPWIHDHMTRAVRRDDWEAYTGLGQGRRTRTSPSHLQRYRTDIFTDKYKRLAWEELSRTITAHIAKDGYWYIHPEQHRTLSIREAARLQTFPDWFRFAGQPSHRYSQIGNAVPPFVGEAVGGALLRSLQPRGPGTNGAAMAGRSKAAARLALRRATHPGAGRASTRGSSWPASSRLERSPADELTARFEALRCARALRHRAARPLADPVRAADGYAASAPTARERSSRRPRRWWSCSMARSRPRISSFERYPGSATPSPRRSCASVTAEGASRCTPPLRGSPQRVSRGTETAGAGSCDSICTGSPARGPGRPVQRRGAPARARRSAAATPALRRVPAAQGLRDRSHRNAAEWSRRWRRHDAE